MPIGRSESSTSSMRLHHSSRGHLGCRASSTSSFPVHFRTPSSTRPWNASRISSESIPSCALTDATLACPSRRRILRRADQAAVAVVPARNRCDHRAVDARVAHQQVLREVASRAQLRYPQCYGPHAHDERALAVTVALVAVCARVDGCAFPTRAPACQTIRERGSWACRCRRGSTPGSAC